MFHPRAAQQGGHGPVLAVCDRQIQFAVSVEIARGQRRGALAGGVVEMRLEAAVAVSQQNADCTGAATQYRCRIRPPFDGTVPVGDG
jgi:hypothetical protein